MHAIGRPVHRRLLVAVICVLIVAIALVLWHTKMSELPAPAPISVSAPPATAKPIVRHPPRSAGSRPGHAGLPAAFATVLGEVDISFVPSELPALLGRALPPPPPTSYAGRSFTTSYACSDDGSVVLWSVSPLVEPSKPSMTSPVVPVRHAWVLVNRSHHGPEFLEVASLCISRDGRHHAYAARPLPATEPTTNVTADVRWVAVRDDVPGAPYRAIRDVTLSLDGNHLAYAATRLDYRECIVCDGRESPPMATAGAFAFSPDSQHFAYAVALVPTSGERSAGWILHLDGRQIAGGPERLAPTSLLFSPDSRHVAVRARVTKTDPEKRLDFSSYAVLLDGQPVGNPAYHDVLDNSLVFSPDSARLLFAAAPEDAIDSFHLYENGQPVSPAHAYIYPDSIRPIAGHLAYLASPPGHGNYGVSLSDNRNISMGYPVLYLDRERLPGLGGSPVFSPDGLRLAYVGTPSVSPDPGVNVFSRGGVVVDGKLDPPLAEIQHLQFSPDGRHYAYLAAKERNGVRNVVVIEGAAHNLGDITVFHMTLDNTPAVTVITSDGGIIRRLLVKGTAPSPLPAPTSSRAP